MVLRELNPSFLQDIRHTEERRGGGNRSLGLDKKMSLGNFSLLIGNGFRKGLDLPTHLIISGFSFLTLGLKRNPAQDELPQVCGVLLVSLVRLMHLLKWCRWWALWLGHPRDLEELLGLLISLLVKLCSRRLAVVR